MSLATQSITSLRTQLAAGDIAPREIVESLTVHVGPYCAGFAAQDLPINRFVGNS